MIKDLANLFLDQNLEGSDSQLNLNDNWRLDTYDNNCAVVVVDSGDEQYISIEDITDIIKFVGAGVEEGTDPIDLLQLVPRKFRSSVLLREFLEECGLMAGQWKLLISELYTLLNPSLVNYQYLRRLGENIGIIWPAYEKLTNDEARITIQQQINWYKIKGTYQSLLVKSLAKSWTINIYDMYTNDYSIFVREIWQICEEDENPNGLDSSYYKSPHFGVDLELITKYTDISGYHLWRDLYTEYLIFNTEKLRPVHTVPHHSLVLRPKTDMSNTVYENAGEIKTLTQGNWYINTYYLDMDILGSGLDWNLDNGINLDTSMSLFLNSITTWKLYNGNYNQSPNDSGFILTDEVATGTDVSYIEYSDRIEFTVVVSKLTTLVGANALALIIPGVPDENVLISTFPNIDKNSDVELRIIISVYKSNL